MRIISYSVLLIPVWWLMGVSFIIFQLVSLLLVFNLLFHKKVYIPKEGTFLLLFIITYIFSILSNISEIPNARLLASLYNLTYWFSAFFFILIFNNIRTKLCEIYSLIRSYRILGMLCGGLGIVAFLLFFLANIKELRFYSPFISFLGILRKYSFLEQSFSLGLIGVDYLKFGAVPRMSLFFGWPTSLGFSMFIVLCFTLLHYQLSENKKKRRFFVILLEVIPLILSGSRTVLVGGICSFLLVLGIEKYLKFKDWREKVLLVYFLFICFLVFLVSGTYKDFISFINSLREGSSNLRTYVYTYAFLTTLQERPFLGFGFKPRIEDLEIPLASHSTLVSNFFKTGILGTIFLILFWFEIYKKWWVCRRKIFSKSSLYLWRYIGIILWSAMFWQITEDIDATPIVPFLLFIVIGLVTSFEKILHKIS